MFSDEIYLRDWEIDTKGKRNVTLATENLIRFKFVAQSSKK